MPYRISPQDHSFHRPKSFGSSPKLEPFVGRPFFLTVLDSQTIWKSLRRPSLLGWRPLLLETKEEKEDGQIYIVSSISQEVTSAHPSGVSLWQVLGRASSGRPETRRSVFRLGWPSTRRSAPSVDLDRFGPPKPAKIPTDESMVCW